MLITTAVLLTTTVADAINLNDILAADPFQPACPNALHHASSTNRNQTHLPAFSRIHSFSSLILLLAPDDDSPSLTPQESAVAISSISAPNLTSEVVAPCWILPASLAHSSCQLLI